MFDTGTGNKQRLINVSKLAAQLDHNHCTALMGLHAFISAAVTAQVPFDG